MCNFPKVWVWVIIINKDDKVLLWKRKNAHGDWTWHFPGGHLEFKEWFIECAKRETLEETNLEIDNVSFVTTTNDYFEKENKHYVTIFMKGYVSWWELKTMEPNKCESWEWFEWNDLPSPLMLPIVNLLKLDINPIQNN